MKPRVIFILLVYVTGVVSWIFTCGRAGDVTYLARLVVHIGLLRPAVLITCNNIYKASKV